MTLPAGLMWLSRTDWGADPVVRSTDGSRRPPVVTPAQWLTLHYTGNPTPLSTRDRAAVIKAQQSLEAYAAGAGKPNEYNYCLYVAAGVGYIVEYAGAYVAAHSAGENDRALGVLFYVAVDQSVSDQMVRAYQWLRDEKLRPAGQVSVTTPQTPHMDMPGAATPCPGPVMDRWADLMKPYTNGGGAVGRMLVRNGNRPDTPDDTGWNAYVVHDGGKYWLPDADALNIARAELGSEVDVTDAWMRAHGPVHGPNPGDEWGCWTGGK